MFSVLQGGVSSTHIEAVTSCSTPPAARYRQRITGVLNNVYLGGDGAPAMERGRAPHNGGAGESVFRVPNDKIRARI